MSDINELQKAREIRILEKELAQIHQWFIDNDWKVNKIVIGEWDKNDPRWLEYLQEREIKRARQDEINNLLNNLN